MGNVSPAGRCNRRIKIMVGHVGKAHFAAFSQSGMGELDAHY